MKIGKPLDSRTYDTLPSTSSLPEGDVNFLVEIRKLAIITKSWAKENVSKVRLFLQHITGIYEKILKTEKAIRDCS